jgi:hypothetical protein
MKLPWTNKTGLARATAVLATTLLVSLGLCGANYAAAWKMNSVSGALPFLLTAAYIETAGIIASALGLLIVGLFAIVKALRNHFQRED